MARALAAGFGALPRRPARGLGAALGGAARRLGARREIVRRQIAAAFPERDPAWVEATVAACYRHFGGEAAEIARLQRTGGGVLWDRVNVDASTDTWVELMAAGRGTIVVTGHLGNWEVAGAFLAARGVPLAAVVKRQRNSRFDAWIAATRRRLGIEPIYMDEARAVIPGLLAEGRSVALVADQDARKRGLMVTFLGQPASTFRGPARLALTTGAPLVFGAAVREGEGYRAFVEPIRGAEARIPASDQAQLELTRGWTSRLERRVRERPEQYFWFHRRWKSGRNEDGGSEVPHAEPIQEGHR